MHASYYFPEDAAGHPFNMPAPYPLLEMPPGDVKNVFDSQAINMACVHNTILQGINAVHYHASRVREDQVQDFMFFCDSLLGLIHHHHDGEEEHLFPELEKKLGKGALHSNVDQHAEFRPQLLDLEEYVKTVQNKEQQLNSDILVGKLNTLCDILVPHLVEEIGTLETNYLQKYLTVREMKIIDDEIVRRALREPIFYTTIPFSLVCSNPATPWFPPLPKPVIWAVRFWFWRRHAKAWEFGPCDISGKLKERAD